MVYVECSTFARTLPLGSRDPQQLCKTKGTHVYSLDGRIIIRQMLTLCASLAVGIVRSATTPKVMHLPSTPVLPGFQPPLRRLPRKVFGVIKARVIRVPGIESSFATETQSRACKELVGYKVGHAHAHTHTYGGQVVTDLPETERCFFWGTKSPIPLLWCSLRKRSYLRTWKKSRELPKIEL